MASVSTSAPPASTVPVGPRSTCAQVSPSPCQHRTNAPTPTAHSKETCSSNDIAESGKLNGNQMSFEDSNSMSSSLPCHYLCCTKTVREMIDIKDLYLPIFFH